MSQREDGNQGGDVGDEKDFHGLGGRIAALSRALPPGDLAAKTVAFVQANCPPKKPVFWLLRPITNPAARVAAAAVIVMMLSPLTDLEVGANLGSRIEQKILGPRMTDKLEAFVDQMMPPGPANADAYFDSFLGVTRPASRKAPAKMPNRRV